MKVSLTRLWRNMKSRKHKVLALPVFSHYTMPEATLGSQVLEPGFSRLWIQVMQQLRYCKIILINVKWGTKVGQPNSLFALISNIQLSLGPVFLN